MELGKQYIVAGVSGALVWMAFWYAPYAVEGALPIVFALAIGIGIGAVSRGK
jgi:putative flippase GtrA